MQLSRLLPILLLSISSLASAQHLTGTVVDGATGKPIPYASVAVRNSRLGTTSNAEGEFELPVPPLPAQLIVSNLGHVRDTIAVTAAQPLRIQLLPASVLLPEVQVGSYAAELIRQAYRRLQQYHATKVYGPAFYRQITRLDSEATEVQEMIWDTKASNAGVESSAMTQSRYAEKKALINFKNFSFYTKSLRIYNPADDSSRLTAVISPNAAQYYTLEVLGVTQNGAQNLVEIKFASKPGLTPRQCQGRLTIDEATHQLLRFYLETPDLGVKSNNPTFTFKNGSTTFDMDFKPLPNGATGLNYLKVDYHARIGRPFKSDVAIQVSSFTSFYDGQLTPPPGSPVARAKASSDLAAIKQAPYNAAFWQNNAVVKRTPLEEGIIKSFEQKGAFGTMLVQ